MYMFMFYVNILELLLLRFFKEVAIATPGRKAILLWTVLWKYVNPIVMAAILIGSIAIQLKNPLQYQLWIDVSSQLDE